MNAEWVTLLLAAEVVFTVFLSPSSSSALANKVNPKRQILIYDLQYQKTNNISIPLTNFGQFGQNAAGSAGDDWPKGSGNPYTFGAGIWVAAILNGDTIVINGYNTVGAGYEFVPGRHYDPNRPEDKLYLSWDPDDLANWPDIDSLGHPIVIGDEDTWGLFNGHDPNEQGTGEKPLPITVSRHSFAWGSLHCPDVIFFFYTIKSDTSVPMTNMYVAIGSDLDVGRSDNDLVGLNRSLGLGYTYTEVQEQGWDAPPPYYVGHVLLVGPRASDTVYVGQDPANPDTTIYPGEHLVLTAFSKFTRNMDAQNDIHRFLLMGGYDFDYIYGPFTDSLDTEPGDKRMAISAGPFELEPGETDTFAIAVLYSNGNTGGLNRLESLANYAHSLYGILFLDAEELAVYPGDTDNNGIVNAVDVLPIGRFWHFTGSPRDSASILWGPHRATPWPELAETYADCNGDGIIDEQDVLAIGVNWRKTHKTAGRSFVLSPDDPELRDYVENYKEIYHSLKGEGESVKDMKRVLLAIIQRCGKPASFFLQTVPNPFWLQCRIEFGIPTSSRVRLEVYDVAGRCVSTFIDNRLEPGSYFRTWDGRDTKGRRASSGVYFCRLTAGRLTDTKQITILK